MSTTIYHAVVVREFDGCAVVYQRQPTAVP